MSNEEIIQEAVEQARARACKSDKKDDRGHNENERSTSEHECMTDKEVDRSECDESCECDRDAQMGEASDLSDDAADGGCSEEIGSEESDGCGAQEEAEALEDEETDKPAKRRLFGGKAKKDKKDEQIESLTDRLTRQMAEFDNFRKRTEKEKAAMYEVGAKGIIEKILPVVDSFERGLAAGETAQAGDGENGFLTGMDQIYKQLMKALEEAGVKPIEAVGQPFDPNYHNAVMHVEDDEFGENVVVEEFQKGYLYRDSVVRHSMVKVAN